MASFTSQISLSEEYRQTPYSRLEQALQHCPLCGVCVLTRETEGSTKNAQEVRERQQIQSGRAIGEE